MSQTTRAAGSVKSYVTGFVLSIIFTLIPYYMVVHKSVSGNALLVTIMCFAMLQMLTQIFFFLHLGRGPKPLYNVTFFVATVTLIMVVVGGSLFIMKHLHYNMTPAETSKQVAEGEAIYQIEGSKTGACQGVKANHKVTITQGKFSPIQTQAHLCDTLSFINNDNVAHKIGFGSPNKPDTYAGETSLGIRKGLSETITLNQVGAYQFFDRLNPTTTGNFTVWQ